MEKLMFNVEEFTSWKAVIIEFRSRSEVNALDSLAGVKTTGIPEELQFTYAQVKDRATLQKIVERDDVVKVWLDETVDAFYQPCFYNPQLNDALPLQGIDQIWDEGFLGEGIVIGVADSGISDHPDFGDRILKRGHTIGSDDKDLLGHGSGVSSCAAGDGEVYKGAAPEASLISVKVLNDSGSGSLSSVMRGLEWLMRDDLHTVDVINLSLGAPMIVTDGSDPLSQTCALAVSKGKTVVCSAGNAGPKAKSIRVPGCREEVIAVGASDKSDRLASFSSKGPTSDGRVKPDLVAVGRDVVMARAPRSNMGTPIDQLYTRASGTSFSSPIVAGVCALLLQKNKKLTPKQVKEKLMKTAIKI